jgi:hypothetical protein
MRLTVMRGEYIVAEIAAGTAQHGMRMIATGRPAWLTHAGSAPRNTGAGESSSPATVIVTDR